MVFLFTQMLLHKPGDKVHNLQDLFISKPGEQRVAEFGQSVGLKDVVLDGIDQNVCAASPTCPSSAAVTTNHLL